MDKIAFPPGALKYVNFSNFGVSCSSVQNKKLKYFVPILCIREYSLRQ